MTDVLPGPETATRHRHLSVVPDVAPEPRAGSGTITNRQGRVLAEVPFHYYQSAQPVDAEPVLIVGGFMGIEAAYGGLARALSTLGKDSITFETARALPLLEEVRLGNVLHPYRLASKSIRAVIQTVCEEYGVERFDVFSHSKGGRDVMWMLHNFPEFFRTAIFGDSVGFGHGAADIVGGAIDFGIHDGPQIIRNTDRSLRSIKTATSFGRYLFARPHRTGAEAAMCMGSNVCEALAILRELDITTAIIDSDGDRLLAKSRSHPEIRKFADHYQLLEGVGHASPITDPELVAGAIMRTLNELHAEQPVPA